MGSTLDTREEIPLLRGALHAVSCPVALVAGAILAWLAPSPRAAVAILLMAIGWAAIFGVSGLYHRVRWWSPNAKRRARQADHAMIFLGMGIVYTAIWLAALDGLLADLVLVYCWVAVTLGMVSKFWFLDAKASSHWLHYVCTSIVAIVVVPGLWQTMGPLGVTLIVAGGLIVAVASIAYVAGRPNPIPGWVGHHEVFHAGTVVGAAMHISALGIFLVR